MVRGEWKRRWIKLYPVDCLEGSIRWQLDAAERGVWYDLLNLAAICATPGIISARDQRPYPHSFVANRLNISMDLLELTLKKCIEEGMITEDGTGIRITHWQAHQSEYDRQKPHRQKKGEKRQLAARFDSFWKAYPRKVGKQDAQKAFERINPGDAFLATMLTSIDEAKKTDGWQKENGKYVPYPATWLNGRRWEDDYEHSQVPRPLSDHARQVKEAVEGQPERNKESERDLTRHQREIQETIAKIKKTRAPNGED